MDLHSLSARGHRGIDAFGDRGLSIDYDALPEGLIALIGRNGVGKTTSMELPLGAFYGEFPSRPDQSFVDAFVGRDAYVDCAVSIEGRGRYRARVNVDQVGRATDAVLERTTPDGRTHRLNDGKVSTFRKAVDRELPSLRMLLASAFASQKKAGAFGRLGKAERRALFAELLGLGQLKVMAATATAAAKAVAQRIAELRAVQAQIEALAPAADEAVLAETGNRLLADALNLAERRELLDTTIGTLEAEVDMLTAQAAQHVAAAREQVSLGERRADREADRKRVEIERLQLPVNEARDRGSILAHRDEAVRAEEEARARLATLADLEADLAHVLDAIAGARDRKCD